jgi:sensor domain CHASE-containing protein
MRTRTRKQRSFTSELLLWISLLVVLPIILLMVYFYTNTFSGLKQVEEEKSILANRAAQLSIESLGETISGVTITNGYWEANRQAVLTRDMAWLNKNIKDMPGVVPNIDFVAETDLQGTVLVQAGNVEEFTGQLKYPELLERFKQEETFYGVLNTSKGVAIVAVSQVTGDQGEEDAVGILITGRFLNNEILEALEHTLQSEMALLTMTGQFLSSTDALSIDDLKPHLTVMEAGSEEVFALERTKAHYLAKVDAPLTDMSGRAIGVIRTQVPSVSTAQAVDGLGQMALYSLGIMAILLILVATLLRQRIILPLRHFTASLEEVAAGRSVDAIPKHVLQAEAQIVVAIQKIMQWNQVLERTVQQRTSSIRSLLDNANQGFLSLGSDLKVREEYSVECTRIFSRNIAGVALPDLLYPDNEAERAVLQSILQDYFAEREELKKELMLSLMPEEVEIEDRILKIEVKALGLSQEVNLSSATGEESIMVMLTDISEKRLLENRMQVEQGMLRMVVQAVTHADDCADIARDFERFQHTEMAETLAGEETPEEKALSLYKTVHTFKGSFGFMQFHGIATRLHALESGLQELLGRADGFTAGQLSEFLQAQHLDTWLKDEENLLKQVLGESYDLLGQNQTVRIEREQLFELERWIETRAHHEEDLELLEKLRAWRYRPIHALLKHYPPYLKEMTDRRGLELHPVLIQGGDVPVDSERYYHFAKSLVHVVRNIVVHGLEPSTERLARGKDSRGTVRFDVEHREGILRLSIEDDGRGINLDMLRQKAAKLWVPENGASMGMPDQELLQLIFREQFSTARGVTEWAGRGIGLAAVKEEVDRLGGEIIVTTVLGMGTKFLFHLPDEGIKGEVTSG